MGYGRGRWVKGRGREQQTFSAHGDGVRHADGVELPPDHAAALNGPLDRLSEVEHCVCQLHFTRHPHKRPRDSRCMLHNVSAALITVQGAGPLTCTGSPPTTRSRRRPGARSSSSPRSGRPHRRAWPCYCQYRPCTSPRGLAHLCAGEVVVVGDGVGPPIQRAAGRQGLPLDVLLAILTLVRVGHCCCRGSGCRSGRLGGG